MSLGSQTGAGAEAAAMGCGVDITGAGTIAMSS
jgi:hypothetical protein